MSTIWNHLKTSCPKNKYLPEEVRIRQQEKNNNRSKSYQKKQRQQGNFQAYSKRTFHSKESFYKRDVFFGRFFNLLHSEHPWYLPLEVIGPGETIDDLDEIKKEDATVAQIFHNYSKCIMFLLTSVKVFSNVYKLFINNC